METVLNPTFVSVMKVFGMALKMEYVNLDATIANSESVGLLVSVNAIKGINVLITSANLFVHCKLKLVDCSA